MNAAAVLARATKPSKYHNRKTTYKGKVFDSIAELRRWQVLEDMERHGEITGLVHHPRFTLQHSFRDWQGSHRAAIAYEADAMYEDRAGKTWVEDTKGVRTKEYQVKIKFFLALYRGYCFREIDARTLRPR